MVKRLLYILKHIYTLLSKKGSGKITWLAFKQAYYLAVISANHALSRGVNPHVYTNLKKVIATYPDIVSKTCIAKALIAISDPKKDPQNFRYINYLYAVNHTEKLFETVIAVALIEGKLSVKEYLDIEEDLKLHDRWMKQSGLYAKVKNVTNHPASHQTLFIAGGLLDGHWDQSEAFAQLTAACYKEY